MQQVNRLWTVVNAAGTVRDFARDFGQERKTYQFAVNGPTTFYLRTENAEVRLSRWDKPLIEMKTVIAAPFGWRLLTDQDEAGVYVAAKRRPVVGAVSGASFEVQLPRDAYVVLKLTACTLAVADVDGEFHIPPQTLSGERLPLLLSGDSSAPDDQPKRKKPTRQA